MKKYIILVISFLFFHVLFSQEYYNKVENIEFKQRFYQCIDNIEAYVYGKKNGDSIRVNNDLFKNSLDSIARFNLFDYSLLMNYDNRLFPYDFEREKKKWIEWYEENKYKNLEW